MRSSVGFFAVLGVALLSVASTGCGHTGILREEASADFNCPESRIHILSGGKTRDVEGCGQHGTYRWTGRTWVREGGGHGPQPVVSNGPPPVNPATPSGPQPIRSQPAPQTTTSPSGGPQAPLPPPRPPGQSL